MHDNKQSVCDIISCSVLCRHTSVGERTNLLYIPEVIVMRCRASKLKDHKIGISPYFLETKSGDILRELFKVLPKTIGLRNDFRTVVLLPHDVRSG